MLTYLFRLSGGQKFFWLRWTLVNKRRLFDTSTSVDAKKCHICGCMSFPSVLLGNLAKIDISMTGFIDLWIVLCWIQFGSAVSSTSFGNVVLLTITKF